MFGAMHALSAAALPSLVTLISSSVCGVTQRSTA